MCTGLPSSTVRPQESRVPLDIGCTLMNRCIVAARAIAGASVGEFAVLSREIADHIRLAQARRRLDKRVEHRLQIECRRLMTLSTSAVAVCCWRVNSRAARLSSRVFSMAMTAWSAKVCDQLDLLVGEWARPSWRIDDDDADRPRISCSMGTLESSVRRDSAGAAAVARVLAYPVSEVLRTWIVRSPRSA